MPDDTTAIYLIRHGQTAWNVGEVFRGRADVPLDDLGHRQARAVAQFLTEEPVAAVYSSPLQRATATAHPIAASHGLEVIVDERLTDMDFGAWEGKALSDVPHVWPDLFAKWERKPQEVTFPGGESLPAVRARSAAALEECASRHIGQSVAIVSHRVITKVLICYVLGLDDSHFWQIRQDTACANRVERTPEIWIVTSINDTCYLRDLEGRRLRDF
jgi:alpha-ribazole phosphatase